MGVWIETRPPRHPCEALRVTPCMGVWIETGIVFYVVICYNVTPCMGVWIETVLISDLLQVTQSHPVWVCGLKP